VRKKMSNKITSEWAGKRYDYEDLQRNTFNDLVKSLKELIESHGIVGIKQSFEDEGAILQDVLTMRRVTELNNASMYVKIGGCEAITDINNCVSSGIDAIIAPMIETHYSFTKFIKSVENISDTEFYFLCETKTAYDNIDEILNSKEAKKISGVILGRSDFTKSHDLDKSEVDSDFIYEKVRKVFQKSKLSNLITTMGGNISTKSSSFIQKLFYDNLLDKIETRNVVIRLNDNNVKNLEETIKVVLNFEIQWLKYKAQNYNSIGNAYLERAETLKKRIK
jgi:hypothetical protein